ncbi:glycosyl transferase family 28 protein [Rhodopirellula sp. JC737]|nr:glycosyltransferase [Rhodopirellula sp. JC737]MCC9658411.1 glycosyl transferase family 28 protein [Rhodopirellula sp. JC737]
MNDSTPRVGFYVHYHGMGHKHRTESILRELSCPASVVTSRIHSLDWNGPTLDEVIGIDCDNDEVHPEGLQHADDVSALHFAPLWTPSVTRRVAQYTRWIDERRPDVMVVDVSAEISLLTRLASVPQIVMRQHGRRDDPAHLTAYEAAHSLLAPFPQSMEDDITPDFVREKTIYLDGFCRFECDPSTTGTNASERTSVSNFTDANDSLRVVVMFGRGGTGNVHEHLRKAAESLPHSQWLVLGKEDNNDRRETPTNLQFLGWHDSPDEILRSADVVITSAGHNSVMELGRSRQRFIAIAEERPFEEQVRKSHILDREGLAIGLSAWPSADQWPDLIGSALQLDVSRWDKVFQRDGAIQAAEHIASVASWSHNKRQTAQLISL